MEYSWLLNLGSLIFVWSLVFVIILDPSPYATISMKIKYGVAMFLCGSINIPFIVMGIDKIIANTDKINVTLPVIEKLVN